MFVTAYQHAVSRQMMNDVLDAYHTLGPEHFRGSLQCVQLGQTQLSMSADFDRLRLAKTLEVIESVYVVYKPQIKAARAQYLAAHPDWVDPMKNSDDIIQKP